MRWGWLIAYSAGLFVASAVALPCWNAFLKDSVGRFLTVEQIHVIEYAGLGGIAAFTFPATRRSWRALVGLGVVVAAVGFLDEALQAFLPQRYFQWSDVFLNWVGIVAGVIVAGVLGKRFRRSRRRALP